MNKKQKTYFEIGVILSIISIILLLKHVFYVIYGIFAYLLGLIFINYSYTKKYSRILISTLIIFSLLFIVPIIYVKNIDGTQIELGISNGLPYPLWSVTKYSNEKPSIGDNGRYYDEINGLFVSHKIIDENKENFIVTDTFDECQINKTGFQKRIKNYPILQTDNFLLACYWEVLIFNVPIDCFGLYEKLK